MTLLFRSVDYARCYFHFHFIILNLDLSNSLKVLSIHSILEFYYLKKIILKPDGSTFQLTTFHFLQLEAHMLILRVNPKHSISKLLNTSINTNPPPTAIQILTKSVTTRNILTKH